ncbi:unnamed protein product [Orchesella dallaii]|uniref:Uncharacterized protein n=1 Tax=Orchesella dallaii TaxID=48710 RepID=A0ABP1QXC3_9HEXA
MTEINSNDLPSPDNNTDIDGTTSAAIFMDKVEEDAAAMRMQNCKLSDSEYHEPSSQSVTVPNLNRVNEDNNGDDKIPWGSEEAGGVTPVESHTVTSVAEIVDEKTQYSKENDEDDVANLIDLLINENKQLQKRVVLAESTIEFIMSKLRRAVTYLLDQPDKNLYEKEAELLKLQIEADKQTTEKKVHEGNLRHEVMELLLSAACIEDNMVHGYDELVTRLRLENRGLRKTLLIASEYSSPCLLTSADKSTQLDEEDLDLYEVLSENDGSYHTARSVYFGSDENAEDCEENSNYNDNDSLSSNGSVVELNV